MSLPNSIGRGMSEQERDAFGNWLAGFVDGEGHFQLRYTRQQYIPCGSFCIKLRGDDLNILYEINKFLGCGSVHGQKERGRSKPGAYYRISSTPLLRQILVPLFEKYPLRAKKARDFAVWKQAVILMDAIQGRKRVIAARDSKGRILSAAPRWTPEEKNEYENLSSELKHIRKYSEVPNLPKIRPLKPRNKKLLDGFFPNDS